MRVLLFAAALLLGFSLFGSGVKYKEGEGAVTVQHPQFRCVVSSGGGQLTSFVTLYNGRELVNPTSPRIDGMGKVKDGLFADITPQLANYDLTVERKSADLVLVRASWLCPKAVFKGVKFVRTFVFDSSKNYITIQESLEAVNTVAELYVEFHNSVSAENFSKDTFFTARGAESDIKFDIKTLNMQGTQSIHDPVLPWFGYLDSDAGNGLAMLFENPKQISCFFAWKNKKHLVMSAKFRKIKIEPVAAAEFWRTEYALIPLQGKGALLHTGRDMAISGKSAGQRSLIKGVLAPAEVKVFALSKDRIPEAYRSEISCDGRNFKVSFNQSGAPGTLFQIKVFHNGKDLRKLGRVTAVGKGQLISIDGGLKLSGTYRIELIRIADRKAVAKTFKF